MSIKIFITNLGKYNEGCLIGQWVRLPIDEDKLEKVLEEIGIDEYYEEYFITDYEAILDGIGNAIGEYTSIKKLNELAEVLDELTEGELEMLGAILEAESVGCITDLLELMEQLDEFDLLSDVDDDEDLGYYYAEEIGCMEIPEHIKSYFDYESYGRDIRLESSCAFTSFGCLIDNR